MKFRFDANQDFQVHAIEAVTDLFQGQGRIAASFGVDPDATGSFLPAIANRLDLEDPALLENLREVQARNGIQPDARLQVSHRGNAREAFLEFTAAMPGAGELKGKLEGYQRLWERTQQPCAVLWFTTSRAKANRLLEGTRSSLFRDCFLVGLIEDARGFLTRPMWRWADADEEERDDVVQWLQPPTAVGG